MLPNGAAHTDAPPTPRIIRCRRGRAGGGERYDFPTTMGCHEMHLE